MCSACGLGKGTVRGLFQSLVLPNLRGKDCYSFKHCPLVEKINISAFIYFLVFIVESITVVPLLSPVDPLHRTPTFSPGLPRTIGISVFRTSVAIQVLASTWEMPSTHPPSASPGRNDPFNNVS